MLKQTFSATSLLLAGLFATTSYAQTLDDLPELTLPGAVKAEQAITAIGNRLPTWAATYDMSVAEFARTLRDDDHAFLDTRGRLYFTEPDADLMPSANADLHGSALYPLSQTFLLESRPESARTLYLDFDGHTLVNTGWNTSAGLDVIDALAWSRDGDRSSFNDTELADIQTIWRRVAEDFAAFDINVTTRFPGEDALIRNTSSDPYFGTRVLVTPNTFYSCSCGGVAYVGTFDYIGSDRYQPALVFNSSVVGIAEAASHEAGHNLGLSHDATSTAGYYTGHGSGATSWAPIMGVGYNRSVVQWSKGEYNDATTTQDDYQVMHNNLLGVSADDHGDGAVTATTPASNSDGAISHFVAGGVIETPADVDAFTFTAGAGALSIAALPSAVSPNLDIGLTLIDSAGNTVVSVNDETALEANLDADLAGGQYTLLLAGVGKGEPLATGYTDYGSLGSYQITAQYVDDANLVTPTATISSDYAPDFAPLTVNFDGSSSTDASSWQWSFGDGSQASGSTATHRYDYAGAFTATLTVVSETGLVDRSEMVIDVINQPPFAQGTIDSAGGELPLSVNVSDGGSYDVDGTIASLLWDFGNGFTSANTTASHSYQQAGEYLVTLTATDNLGAQTTAVIGTIVVTAPAFVDSVASSETSIAGSVNGDYTRTHITDGNTQVIRESESGGKPSNRYSYAEHEWQVNVPQGESRIEVWGSQTASVDNDRFIASWFIGNQSGVIGEFGTTGAALNVAGIAQSGGQLTIKVADSDRTRGSRSLDSVFIDSIVVVTDTTVDPGAGGGGDNSSNVDLALVSTYKQKGENRVDLSWQGSGSEYQILRDGISLGTTTSNSFTDSSLGKGGMTIRYQVCNENADCSNTLTVTF